MTDRIDLDDQLYTQFSQCADFLRQTPVQAESKEHLKSLLYGRSANGIIFTTMLEQQSDTATIEKSKKMLGQMESVLGADSTIESLCDDIVEHYEKYRANLLTGKAMIVAYSRPIAMKIYRRILEIRPTWKEKVGVVMTGGNNDPEDWKEIIGTKSYKEVLARKFKDNNDRMKIAIVVDM